MASGSESGSHPKFPGPRASSSGSGERPRAGSGERARPAKDPDDPEREEFRNRVRLGVAVGLALAAIAGTFFLVTWKAASPRSFVLRDAVTSETVSDSLLTVVIDARRKPQEEFPSSARRLTADLYGRYDPPPETPGELSEIYAYHIAYRPLCRGNLRYGVIVLERHGGASFPELEAQLRALGDIDAGVAEGLKAAFLRPGPSSRVPAAGPPPTPATTIAAAPSAGASTGAPPGASTAASTGPSIALPITIAEPEPPPDPEAEEAASSIERCLNEKPGPSRKAALAQLDTYLGKLPKEARVRATPGMRRAIGRGFEAAEPQYDLTCRLFTLSGALWHGSGSAPPFLIGVHERIAGWPSGAARELAQACARIGGGVAARELVALIEQGDAPADGPWIATSGATGSRAAIRQALEESRARAEKGGKKAEEARLKAALDALLAAPAPAPSPSPDK